MFLRTMSALLVSGVAFSSLAYAMDPADEYARQMRQVGNEAARQIREIGEEYTRQMRQIGEEYTQEQERNNTEFNQLLGSLKGMTIQQKKAALQNYQNSKK